MKIKVDRICKQIASKEIIQVKELISNVFLK
jgi:hypothetical protein